MFPVAIDAPHVDRPAIVRPAEAEVTQRPQLIKDVFQPWIDRGRTAINDVMNHLNPPLTAEEREAAQFMKSMMAPDKLGGADRTFNHQDIEAVTAGITDRGVKGVIARSLASKRLPAGLDEAGVARDPNAKADETPRRISASELQEFQRAGELLEARKAGLKKLGLDVQFPNGPSEAAFDHLLEGRFGLPPGAKLVRVAQEP